jgi:hypothetical protein
VFRVKILLILTLFAAIAFAKNDTTVIFQGCGGGMMLHAGYLFGQPSGAALPTGENISPQGMTCGLGGSMRVNLWKHLRVGMEGFSSNLKTGVSNQHEFLQKGSYIRKSEFNHRTEQTEYRKTSSRFNGLCRICKFGSG